MRISTAHEPAYGPVAKALHWLVALLLAGQFAVAWTMPHIRPGTLPEGLIGLHLSLGVLIMLVVVVRLAWRATHRTPAEPDDLPAWQRLAAQATHVLLYGILIVLPVLGWASASSRGWPVGLFGILPLPQILPTGAAIGHTLGDLHGTLAWILVVVVGLHVAAALYHAILRRDQVLQRMLPSRG